MAEQVYVGVYSPGAGWRTGVPVNEQPLFADHGAQMRRLFADGRSLLSGPFADLAGGMAIVRAESTKEAERLLREGDAMVERDVARGEEFHRRHFRLKARLLSTKAMSRYERYG